MQKNTRATRTPRLRMLIALFVVAFGWLLFAGQAQADPAQVSNVKLNQVFPDETSAEIIVQYTGGEIAADAQTFIFFSQDPAGEGGPGDYADSAAYGAPTVRGGTRVLGEGLEPDTTYYYSVVTAWDFDEEGNPASFEVWPTEGSFETSASTRYVGAPSISDVRDGGETWDIDVDVTADTIPSGSELFLLYSTNPVFEDGTDLSSTPIEPDIGPNTITLTDLDPNESYYVVAVFDWGSNANIGPEELLVASDTTAPGTPSITGSPGDPTNATSATFTWSGAEAGGTFQCKIDSGDYSTCTSPKEYTGLAEGSHTFYVRQIDSSSNVGEPASNTWSIDTTKPTASWSGTPSSPNKNTSVQYTLTFSEWVSDITSDDFANPGSATGCSFSPSAFSGTSFTVTISSCSEGTLQPRFGANGAFDAAGNTGPNSFADGTQITLDRTAPAAPTIAAITTPTNSTSVSVTWTGAEGGGTYECKLDGGSYSTCTSPKSYTSLAEGSHTVYVRQIDAAGNTGTADSKTWTVDTTKPTASWSNTPSSPNKDQSVSYTLTFSESVTNVASGDFSNLGSATSCTFAPGTDTGTTRTVTISGCTEGTLQPRFAANGATDAAGNTGPASAADGEQITLDRTAPTLTLAQAAGQADPTNQEPIQFTLSGNENLVSGTITSADFTIGNGTVTSISGSGTSYTVNVDPTADGAVTITPSGTFSVTDTAGNAATSAGGSDRSVTYDTTKPTASWSNTPSSPNKDASLTYTLTFNESVTGVAAGDFSNLGSATGCTFSSSGSTGTSFTITISSCTEGTLQPRFAENGASDAAGNTGPSPAADASQIILDRTAPTLTLQQAGGQADPTSSSPVLFSLTGNENLNGATVTEADFTITNAQSTSISGSGSSYTISVTPSGQGAVTIAPSGSFSVTDTAGNAATTAGGSDRSVTYDTAKPTVSWSNTPSSPNKNTSVQYTLTFNESVTGVAAGDFSNLGSATGCSFSPGTDSGTTRTVTISSCSEGTLQPRFAINGATDAAGNTGPASAADATQITLDRTGPTATWSGTPSSPNKNTSVTYTLTFNESVTGVASGDFTNLGSATGCSFAPGTDSGETRTVTISSCTEGTLQPRFVANGATDAAGNTGPATAADGAQITLDRTAPSAPTIAAVTSPVTVAFVDISWTGEGGGSYECKLNSGGSWGSCSSPKTYSSLSNGSYTVYVRQTDAAGNVGAEATRTFTVSIADGSAPITSTYQPGQATNGTGVTIGVQAEDWAGRTGETSQVIKYDPSAPVITITGCSTPDGNSGWWKTRPTCSISVTDSQSQISSSTYSINGGTAVAFGASPGPNTTNSTSVAIQVDGNPVNLTVNTTNAAGLTSSQSINMQIDTAAPSGSAGTLTSPKAETINLPAVSVTDSLSKPGRVANLQYSRNGTTWFDFAESCGTQSLTGSDNTQTSSICTINSTSMFSGYSTPHQATFTLRAKVEDKAGNTAYVPIETTSASKQLIVRNSITFTFSPGTVALGSWAPSGGSANGNISASSSYSVLAGKNWDLSYCVPTSPTPTAIAPFLSVTVNSPTSKTIAPNSSISQGCGVTANSIANQVATDAAVSVGTSVGVAGVNWSLQSGSYTQPLLLQASQ